MIRSTLDIFSLSPPYTIFFLVSQLLTKGLWGSTFSRAMGWNPPHSISELIDDVRCKT
jgi:hypothetical protein